MPGLSFDLVDQVLDIDLFARDFPMKRPAFTSLAALILIAFAGCSSEPLPDAPPPVRDAYSDPAAAPPAPKATTSAGDAKKRYNVESGASPEAQ